MKLSSDFLITNCFTTPPMCIFSTWRILWLLTHVLAWHDDVYGCDRQRGRHYRVNKKSPVFTDISWLGDICEVKYHSSDIVTLQFQFTQHCNLKWEINSHSSNAWFLHAEQSNECEYWSLECQNLISSMCCDAFDGVVVLLCFSLADNWNTNVPRTSDKRRGIIVHPSIDTCVRLRYPGRLL